MLCRARKLMRMAPLYGMVLVFAAALYSQPRVLTWHNDNFRTGQNLQETVLTPANVKASTFGKLFTIGVDGKVDGQPLYVPGLTIPGLGVHNVLYIATEHDSVYAMDADNGALLKQVSLLVGSETTSDIRSCGSQVSPEIGVTATPVIDPQSGPHGTIYVVAMTKDTAGGYHQRLHALDLTTLAEEFGGPVEVVATYPGVGDEKKNSGDNVQTFLPGQHMDRSALLLANGIVYTTWSSHCDISPYTSWVIGYNESNLSQATVLNLVPNGRDGGIWASGSGPQADAAGNVYLPTGNGTFSNGTMPIQLNGSGFPVNNNFGNAYVRMSSSAGHLAVADYFTMSGTVSETMTDADLGSGGGMLLPPLIDTGGQSRDLAVVAGKDANIYVMDRNNLGKFKPSTDEIYQQLSGVLAGGMWSSPAWFNNTLYYGPQGNVLKAFTFANGRFGTNPASQTSAAFVYPGTTPSISANGSSNGIVWATIGTGGAVLHAYSASNLSNELYNTNQEPNGRDHFGGGNKFVFPTIVNGKVYVASNSGAPGHPGSVAVFGLLGQQPDFSFTVTPGLLAVAPGASDAYTINMMPLDGFTGTVNFSVLGLPSGASATFTPASITGTGSTTLTIMTGSASTGSYALTVKGTSGTLNHTSPVTLVVAVPAVPAATFVTVDTATQGNWFGVYGGDGYAVIGDQSLNPAYVAPLPAGQSQTVWTSSTVDPRGLQKALNPSDRIAGVWYSSSSFTVDLFVTDGNIHPLAVYCLDWDTTLRRQTVEILDPNGNVLNTHSLASSFHGGVYLVWNIRGHVQLRVTVTGGANAVVSGLFFGPASNPAPVSSSASFVRLDTATQGSWQGTYGTDGYLVVGDLTSNPTYVAPSASGQSQAIWAGSTADARAPRKASNPSDRIAGVWYSYSSFTVDLNITDANTHQVALYCLDWDTAGRRETVDVLDGAGNVLNTQSLTNSFHGGAYLVWNVTGHVKIRVTLTGGANAVMSGLFFGGTNIVSSPGAASFVTLDTTTQGSWQGVYGSDGYNVIGDQAVNPSYVTPVAAGQGQAVWASTTSDARGLQKASNPSDRIAGVWYSYSSFTVDLNITDANPHQVALYCLDWDTSARQETVDVLDGNGNVLNTQSLNSSFHGGVYLVWNVSGHVKLRVTLTGGANAVASGLFFH